eukprot:TRINITY_DN8218_c0_g2_i1.p1 TRINITY_DN8218_c0_g2~~TRINITY_DN8218_c0_g2_i1.p1  ORF type:complete len:388 (-),score=88.21 TRINITY_DN8218_c0_g2_i1:134-1297(-)
MGKEKSNEGSQRKGYIHMGEKTPEIKQIFQMAKCFADGIARLMGKNVEVVVHDFSDLSSSLVHVAGSVTNRQVGAPITDLIYKRIKEHSHDVEDIHGYKTLSHNGRILKSSTMFLRTSANKVVGCLCVNSDITELLNAKALLDDLTGFDESDDGIRGERFASSFNETLGSLIDEAVAQAGKQPATMDKVARLNLLRTLDVQEVFLFKGAVNQVARVFGVSRYTIYNDLKEIRAEENDIQFNIRLERFHAAKKDTMTMQTVTTDKAPAAVGPYSQATISNGLLFVSGQLPIDPAKKTMIEGSIGDKAAQSLTNLGNIAEAAGTSLKNAVKVTVFLTDMNDFAAVNEVYKQFFAEPFPARSAIQVAALPMGGEIEIEAILTISDQPAWR